MLDGWAKKWGIPQAAMDDLALLAVGPPRASLAGLTEGSVQTRIRAKATQLGGRLWRNNVGAYKDNHGNYIRYGLANESRAMNMRNKSSDLIGIYPVVIKPEMVGNTIGQFWAIEVKKSLWTYRGDAHERAQLHFINLVLSLGGRAQFCNDEELLCLAH